MAIEQLKRCKARMPKRVRGIHRGGRCGMPEGHKGHPHTLLIPSGMPWFGEVAKRPDRRVED